MLHRCSSRPTTSAKLGARSTGSPSCCARPKLTRVGSVTPRSTEVSRLGPAPKREPLPVRWTVPVGSGYFLVSFAGFLQWEVSLEERKAPNWSTSSFPSPWVTRPCRHSPWCLALSRLSYCGRLRTSLFRLGVLAGPQLLLELLPEPDCVWTRQGLHPRVFASGARRLVPQLVQSSTGATDAAREPLFVMEVLLRKLDRQSVLWPVLLDAKSNGLVSAIGAVLRASGFHSFAACGAHRWPAHRPTSSHSVPGVKGTVGEPSSPIRACPLGEASTAGRRPPADLLGSSRRHELPFHSWPSLCHAFYGLASRWWMLPSPLGYPS